MVVLFLHKNYHIGLYYYVYLAIFHFTTAQLPFLFDPIRSINPFFFNLTKVRSIVLFVTTTSIAIFSAVISGLLINKPSTAFSVLFIPTFMCRSHSFCHFIYYFICYLNCYSSIEKGLQTLIIQFFALSLSQEKAPTRCFFT